MATRGKKYQEAAAKIDRQINYAPREAIELVRETSFVKFDATVEVHIRLGVDPRQSDQQVRGVVLMPAGLGKTVRVLVFAEGEGARLARESGADFVIDDEEGYAKIRGGWTEFDVALAMPEAMREIGKLGKVLGPRGLMPNPKAGTVAPAADIPRLIQEARAGRAEFRIDKTSNLHVPIGKVSFSADALFLNFSALMDAVKKARPTAAKGTYIKRVVLTSTMGPGIRMDVNLAQMLETV
ncbi:MAG: 50S ribosomal protein L1 [Thermoflexales bacterium]|nr:50S ribosomal protein L1 [Thermoflexales bacterium]